MPATKLLTLRRERLLLLLSTQKEQRSMSQIVNLPYCPYFDPSQLHGSLVGLERLGYVERIKAQTTKKPRLDGNVRGAAWFWKITDSGIAALHDERQMRNQILNANK